MGTKALYLDGKKIADYESTGDDTRGHLDKFLAEPELWQRTSSYLGVFRIRLPLSG